MDLLRAKAARSLASIAALAVSLSSLGCAIGADSDPDDEASAERIGTERADIQGGFADGADLAVVGVAIVGDDGNIEKTCSGVLIGANLVLTAQHCIASKAQFTSCAYASFGPPVDPARVYVTTDASMWSAKASWREVIDVAVPPGSPAVCGRDIALVTLEDPADGVRPLAPSLDEPCEASTRYTAIGYGASSGTGKGAGERRRRDGLSVLCVGGDCDSDNITTREWKGDHGICDGDSGSPAIGADGKVFGITSRGPSGCDDPVYGGLAEHRDWLMNTAKRAANEGGIDPPKWAAGDGSTAQDQSAIRAAESDGACAFSPGRPASSGFAVAVLALALAAARRRQVV